MTYEINPLIIEKVESLEIDKRYKAFIKEILRFERRKMNLEGFRYKEDYEKIIDRYIDQLGGDHE